MTLTPGMRLGAYEITSALGAGGMGEVYRARDTRLQRDVAVKVLAGSLATHPDALARFEREARAVAALSHPGIVALFDVGSQDGLAFAVMELLDGETLRERLVTAPVPVRKAVEIAAQLARALAAAHERGVVHRDLKPENVFLTRDGLAKVLDFGLARQVDASEAVSTAPTEAGTAPGTVLGTVGYMSPEQVRGLPADHRSDIFSFGSVFHEMLSGRRAFQRASGVETMNAILKEEPPDLAATLPPPLVQIVRHCLEKRPEDRFQSARDLAFALESLSAPSSSGIAPASALTPASRRRLLPWLLAAAALAAGVVAGRALPRRAATVPRLPVRFAIPPAPGASYISSIALSPAGRELVYVATTSDGGDHLFFRDLGSLEARLLPGTDGASFPFFSPDGRQIGFFAQRSLKTVDVLSGAVKTLCPAPDARGGSWSRDGFILFAPRAGAEIDSVPETGGDPKLVLATSKDVPTVRWPSLLSDGRRFLYVAFSGANVPSLYAGSVDSSTTRLLMKDAATGSVAGGMLITSNGRRVFAQPFDERALVTTAAPSPLWEDVSWDGFSSGYVGLSVSAQGALAVLPGGTTTSRLVWYDRSGAVQGAVGPIAAYFEPALSPDEKRVAVSRVEATTWASEIYLLDLVRGGLARLSHEPFSVTPLFSPDGTRVAYAIFPGGRVYARDASGTGEPTLLFENDTFCVLEDWAPDGRLFYTSLDLRNFRFRAFVRKPGGAAEELLTGPGNFQHARLSPDGRHVAYVSDEAGAFEVLVRSYPDSGDRFTISAGGGSQPQWRGDGKELFYVTPDRKIMAVPIATTPRFEPGKPVVLFQSRILPEVEARNHYAATRDGQRFLVNERREEDATRAIVVALDATAEPAR